MAYFRERSILLACFKVGQKELIFWIGFASSWLLTKRAILQGGLACLTSAAS
jgi:hypothetical protein